MGRNKKRVIFMTSFCKRLRGLLFTKPHDSWLVFSPCKGIHTFGMRYKIDIAFLDREGIVTESFRGVGPMKTLRDRRAVVVIERFESQEPWFDRGDSVHLGVSDSISHKK